MAHTKSQGKTRQQPPRPGKRLGVKCFGGEKVKTGQIIIRQRGSRVSPGKNTALGRDHTLYATKTGLVSFSLRKGKKIASIL